MMLGGRVPVVCALAASAVSAGNARISRRLRFDIRSIIRQMPTLAFIHTSHVLIPLFTELAKKHLAGVETFHMLDESLIRNTIRAGGLTEGTTHRVAGMIDLAREGGADVVM